MKLRLQGNSVRLRLTRSEVERLRETGLEKNRSNLAPANRWCTGCRAGESRAPSEATFRQGVITVTVSQEAAQAWAGFRRSRPVCAKQSPQHFDRKGLPLPDTASR